MDLGKRQRDDSASPRGGDLRSRRKLAEEALKSPSLPPLANLDNEDDDDGDSIQINTMPSRAKGVRNRHISPCRQEAWLERSKAWRDLQGSWKGLKVLGAGGYGIVGLFKHLGIRDEGVPQYIVVKQSPGDNRALEEESRLLKLLMNSGTEHIVKLLRGSYLDRGTWTSSYDPAPDPDDEENPEGMVTRMYLEYCENGDMSSFLSQAEDNPAMRSEPNIWRIFNCIAAGARLLEHGNESSLVPDTGRPMAHFDIKPANILVGGRDISHRSTNIFKIADFGLAQLVPPVDRQSSADWISKVAWRATQGWASPEQRDRKHPNRTIGLATNIWAIGAVMYCLITGEKRVGEGRYRVKVGDFGGTISTFGGDLVDATCSNSLKRLVFRCLAYDPKDRPSSNELLNQTLFVVRRLDTTVDPLIPGEQIVFEGIGQGSPDDPEADLPTTTSSAAADDDDSSFKSLIWNKSISQQIQKADARDGGQTLFDCVRENNDGNAFHKWDESWKAVSPTPEEEFSESSGKGTDSDWQTTETSDEFGNQSSRRQNEGTDDTDRYEEYEDDDKVQQWLNTVDKLA